MVLVISICHYIFCSLLPLCDFDLPCLRVVALGQFYLNALTWLQIAALGLVDDSVLI